MHLPVDEVRRIAARLAPVQNDSPPPKEPIRHWNRIRALIDDEGPLTYIKVHRRLGLTRTHASMVLKRLFQAGFLVTIVKGIAGPQGRATVYGFAKHADSRCCHEGVRTIDRGSSTTATGGRANAVDCGSTSKTKLKVEGGIRTQQDQGRHHANEEEAIVIVMPSNNSGIQIGYLAGRHPGRLGWLIGPGGWRVPPSWMPYALDNGAFGAWSNRQEWDEGAFIALIERAKRHHFPKWVVVPDVVTDRAATIQRWNEWAPRVREYMPRVPLAFAVQDGMDGTDVPENADIVFIGGTTEWKWKSLRVWTQCFPRVHVARVNSERMLWMAYDAGAESCDGTGWMRGGEERIEELGRFLEATSGKGMRPQIIMESILS